LDKRHEVADADKPFEFFMNRFRLLEAAPREEYTRYTGLTESTIRTQLDEAIARGYLTETPEAWQITEKGKLFLNSLLELFLAE
ncbi:MAG TPA: YggW family oxidoreductase, partial [Erwinia persicina]|nr:YggW family oxidoreductase [Erwinia persicina]HBT55340.1 YggW family oxidoreductase [Erwinia persicina]